MDTVILYLLARMCLEVGAVSFALIVINSENFPGLGSYTLLVLFLHDFFTVFS